MWSSFAHSAPTGKVEGREKEPAWEATADPREQWWPLYRDGSSGDRRKQMYAGYILETELADFANALNPEGLRVRQRKKQGRLHGLLT